MYKYDNEGKVVYSYVYDSETYTNLNGTRVVYDDQSRVFSIFHSFDYKTSSGVADDTTHYNYNYNAETGNLAKLKADGAYFSGEMIPTYDKFGRTDNKIIDFSVNGSKAFYNKLIYDYVTNADSESVLVSQLISQVGKTSSNTTSTTYNYTYDDNGNITQITNASGVIQNKYYYDALGQLTREDNRAFNSTYTYSYDNAGNITSKKRYAFTTGTLGSVLNTFSYTYCDSTWKDLLTNYNGTSISYDTIGNPTSIGNDILTWQGRQLMHFENFDCQSLYFEYNADGIRTRKTFSDAMNMYDYSIVYMLNGSQILGEHYSYNDCDYNYREYTVIYIYDETGSPIGLKYREPSYAEGVYNCYFFEKNLQGDIIAIYNSNGTKIGTYIYDAWGNVISSATSSATTLESLILTEINPFRYRGYYYDRETGWYYLQSRYYNPEWGRFLNADGYIGTGGFAGYNLFTYCRNNPVRYCDYSGMCSHIMGVPGVACKYCDPDEWAGIESSDAIATPPKTQEFESCGQGISEALLIIGSGCELSYPLVYFSYTHEPRPNNISQRVFEKKMLEQLDDATYTLKYLSEITGTISLISDVSIGVIDNSHKGASWDKILFDASIDAGLWASTTWLNAAASGALSGSIGGVPGIICGALLGVGLSAFEWYVFDYCGIKEGAKNFYK